MRGSEADATTNHIDDDNSSEYMVREKKLLNINTYCREVNLILQQRLYLGVIVNIFMFALVQIQFTASNFQNSQ